MTNALAALLLIQTQVTFFRFQFDVHLSQRQTRNFNIFYMIYHPLWLIWIITDIYSLDEKLSCLSQMPTCWFGLHSSFHILNAVGILKNKTHNPEKYVFNTRDSLRSSSIHIPTSTFFFHGKKSFENEHKLKNELKVAKWNKLNVVK